MKQIKIIGVGSGCTNILNRVILNKQLKRKLLDNNVTFCAIDSNKQFLNLSSAEEKLLINNGQEEEGFLGIFEEAEKTAMTYENEIKTLIGNPDILIVVSTLGGGTGTGITPLVVKLANEKNIETVSVVSIPFLWEGKKRINGANNAVEKIKNHVQNCVVISSEKTLSKIHKKIGVKEAFAIVDNEIFAKIEEIKYKYGTSSDI